MTPIMPAGLNGFAAEGIGYRVECHHLSYSPDRSSQKRILNDISLTIENGQFVAILGSNGSGKTSLLRAIAGELPPDDVSGEVRIAGQIVDRPVHDVVDGVGIVHQFDDADLIERLSTEQNIAIRQLLGGSRLGFVLGPAITPAWRRGIISKIGSCAPGFEIDLARLVENLAGGERQLLSVIIAIHLEHKVNPCRLLLLDEHTSRLDQKRMISVMQYTVQQVSQRRITTVMVTHRYSDAIQFADRILVIRDGSIAKDGDIADPRNCTVQHLTTLMEGPSR